MRVSQLQSFTVAVIAVRLFRADGSDAVNVFEILHAQLADVGLADAMTQTASGELVGQCGNQCPALAFKLVRVLVRNQIDSSTTKRPNETRLLSPKGERVFVYPFGISLVSCTVIEQSPVDRLRFFTGVAVDENLNVFFSVDNVCLNHLEPV